MTSVKDQYSITTLDVVVFYKMVLEAIDDSTASSSFVGKASKMRRPYVKFSRKQVDHRLGVCFAALQITYSAGLVFIDSNYQPK
jgi:hypothetical protein